MEQNPLLAMRYWWNFNKYWSNSVNSWATILITVAVALIQFSCKEESVIDTPKAPVIHYVDPLVGTVNTEVTIVGENFESIVEDNEVTINGKSIEVLAATEREIKVKIPMNVGAGEVTVTTKVAKARGPLFTYYNEVVVTSVDPLSGPFNTVVVIKGENFETDKALNKVNVNGKEMPLLSVSETEIVFTIPKATGSGTITVSTQYSMFDGPTFTYELVPVVYNIAGSGEEGFADANGEAAQFSNPDGLALDAEDNIYVCDRGNHRVRKIDVNGNVSSFAGSGVQGNNDGDLNSAAFNLPSGIVMGSGGNFFVTDSGSGNIRKITVEGQVITLAGDGVPGFTDGVGSTARFGSPRGIVQDNFGNLWIVDQGNSVIRTVTPAGVVTTLAGDGIPGFIDGTGAGARFNFPMGVAKTDEGDMLIADHLNNRIRITDLNGITSTFAGDGNGFVDGNFSVARFTGPSSLAYDLEGNLIVADALNYRVRMINVDGIVTTIAGNGTKGFKNGYASQAQFEFINAVIVNTKGEIIVSDGGNHVIRKITFE